MKTIFVIIIVLCFVSVLFAAQSNIKSGTIPSTAGVHAWETVETIYTEHLGFYLLIGNHSADSTMAYKIDAYLYPASARSISLVDSTSITGIDADLIEYVPSGFGRLKVKLYNVSNEVDYWIESVITD